MLTANMHHQGENKEDKARYELPVVKRSPEIYRDLGGRAWPVEHEEPGSGLNPPVDVPDQSQPRVHERPHWSPLRRMLMIALIMSFLGLETQLFWDGVTTPETASTNVEIVAPAAAEAATAPQPVIAAAIGMPPTLELIYDATGSMLVPVKGAGTHRWDIAKDGVQAWLNSGAISLDSSFGMQSYGQQRSTSCSLGTALPLAPYSFEQAYNGIADTYPAAGGSAAIAASLKAVVTDMSAVDGAATIVLVASSAEGCGGDPAAEAAAFASGQTNRHVNVVGIAVDDPKVIAHLQSIAEQGNGKYVGVSSSDELATALQKVASGK